MFRNAFDLLDADRDGRIGPADLKSFFSSSSSASSTAGAVSDDEIGSMIAVADLDRNGFVEFGEFERVLVGDPPCGEDRWVEEVFRAMDRDGDGWVGFEDLKAHLGAAGMAAGDDEVRAMIGLAGDGEARGVRLEGLQRILTVDIPRWI